MINIDSLILEDFCKENEKFFVGAKVQRIQQPTRRELILHLRNNFESRKLYININPALYHIAFMSKDNENRRHISIPKQPPMFCMLLRKHMEGAKITKIIQPKYERILELYFENYSEIGDKIEECLSIELMGKHSNVVLYNTDNNIIIGCAHNIGAQKSKERELAGGLPFVYPPKLNKKNLLTTRSATFVKVIKDSESPIKKLLNEKYYGFTQITLEEILTKLEIQPDTPARKLCDEQIQILFIALHEYISAEKRNYSIDSEFKKFSSVLNLPVKYQSVSALIDDYFAFYTEKTFVENLKSSLKSGLEKELKKLKEGLKYRQKLFENKDKSLLYKLKADLIMANLYSLKPGAKKVFLKDFDGVKVIEIDLDENLSLTDNANKYYTKYNKAKKAYNVAVEFAQEAQREISYLEELLFSVDIANSVESLQEIAAEIDKEHSPQKLPESIIDKREIRGFVVYIGKNNRQNDLIYSKISSPNDLWFHVLNAPGAHILVKPQNSSQEPDNELLLYAANLAKEYSTQKNSGKVSVIYTKRKYLKKPPNQKGGMVTYKNETEIVVP